MSLEPRVLIVAREDGVAGPLAAGLDRLGWRTATARGSYGALALLADFSIEAAIIDLDTVGVDPVLLARKLKQAAAPRRLPVVALGEGARDQAAGAFDLALPSPPHPNQAAMRLDALLRTAVAEEEFERRLLTFAERGCRLELPEQNPRPYRVLAVGEPAPQFLALSHALSRAGAEAVGAFTAYTAFDYLHERTFDAVVLWAGGDQSEALSIAAGMRRNTRLFHLPALLCLKEGSAVTPSEAYARGVSDVAGLDTPPEEAAGRAVELAKAYRRQSAIRQALDKARASGLMDAATGLFTRELFAAHLARLARKAGETQRPLSVCVLKVADRPLTNVMRREGWLERAIPQIGSMIGRLVRAEDTAARVGPEVFALALPGTGAAQARLAAERIAAVIACTGFEAGPDRPAFVVDFDIGASAVAPGEPVGAALERAAAGTPQRQAG
ncbi:MAG TPA: diguanylate cyclase [Caulobacteraceae bacterium]